MKNNQKKIEIIALIGIISIFIGCSSIPTKQKEFIVPECVTSDYKGFSIDWGYDYEDSKTIMGYQLAENGYVVLYHQARQNNEKKLDTVGRVEPERICDMLQKLNSEMLKIPTVSEPGKKLSFIILRKPSVNMTSRFIWNEYNTFASRGYRELFDSLMSIVPVNIPQ